MARLIAGMLLLTGCSTVWAHRSGTHDEQRWNQDVADCEYKRLSVMPPGTNMIGVAMANDMFDRCMMGKGYAKQ